MTLQFNVQNQIITRADSNKVVADSVDYLEAEFTFTTDWNGVAKTAIFSNIDNSISSAEAYSVILVDNKCTVPSEVIKAGLMAVSVVGGERITANVVKVPIIASGYVEGQTPAPITPSLYEQIMAILSHLMGGTTGKVLAKRSNSDFDFIWITGGGGGGGSTVTWEQIQESGTKIATITIDDIPVDVYIPTPFSGKYADLSGKPTIPSALSDLTEDSTHRTVTDAEKTSWNGKSVVACTQELSTGTLIGTITINGTTVNLYAPNGGGGGDTVSWTQVLLSGTKVGTITINGTPTDVYAPTPFSGDYEDLTNKPTIPTKTSQLTNDSGFLTQHQSIKTLNGETLVGTGNVSTYQSETVTVSGGTASKQLTAHKLCVFDGAASSLTITFPASVVVSDEFNFVFTTGANGCTLTLPNTVKWDGGTPVFANSTTYEVSIDGFGIALISQGVSAT